MSPTLTGLGQQARRTEIVRAASEAALTADITALEDRFTDWQDYTPTLSGFTIGNGTITARYALINGTCFVEDHINFGSTSTFPGGVNVEMTLPFSAAAASGTRFLEGGIYINSVGSGLYPMRARFIGGNNTRLMRPTVFGSELAVGNVQQGAPATFTSNSGILRWGFYQVA